MRRKTKISYSKMFKKSCFLFLDEATSALDKESEINAPKIIDELQKGRTSIVIAHRLNTIIGSDIIFDIESGKIVEKGDIMN